MAYVKGQPFIPQFTDPATGLLMTSGTIEFYLTGTSTPTPYYTDSAGTSGGTSLTLNSGGKPGADIYFDTDITYKLILKSASGTTLDTIDPFSVMPEIPLSKISEDGVLKIGTDAYINAAAQRDTVYVGRTRNDTSDAHGFTDRSFIGAVSDSGTYGSFDSVVTYNDGTGKAYNHLHAFQDRNIFNGSGSVAELNGFYSDPDVITGTVDQRNAVLIKDVSGGGTTTINTGIRIKELAGGTNNFSIVSEGTVGGYHGGGFSFGYPISSPDAATGIKYVGISTTGTSQRGIRSAGGCDSTATFQYSAFEAVAATSPGSYTTQEIHGLAVRAGQQGSGTTVERSIGILIEGQTVGSVRNSSIEMETVAGANNWNIYQAGNAANWFSGASKFGSSVSQATAQAEFTAQTTAANSAPIKLNSGSLMTTPETGAFEFDGTNLYFTISGTRRTVTVT